MLHKKKEMIFVNDDRIKIIVCAEKNRASCHVQSVVILHVRMNNEKRLFCRMPSVKNADDSAEYST